MIGSDESSDPKYDINKADEQEVNSYPTLQGRQVRKRLGTRRKKNRRAADYYLEEISKSLDNLVSAMNAPPPTTYNESEAEIIDCMRILKDISETAEIGDLLMFAFNLFQKKEEREFFTAMSRRDWQLAWLKMKYADSMGPGASGTK